MILHLLARLCPRHVAYGGIVLLAVLGLSACGTSRPFVTEATGEIDERPPDSLLVHSIFLIGDAGSPHREAAQDVLALLDSMLAERGEASTVIFLGDNIYPSGMPPVTNPAREDAENRIDALLDVVQDHPGRVIFVPGNHDWGGVGLGGNRAAVIRQEEYVETRLERTDAWLPDRGFPGPVAVDITDGVELIVIDTQWWLEENKPYGDTGTYELEQEGEFLLELDDLLWRNADKHLVVVGHHPVFSNGEHGGYFEGLRSLFSGERLARGYLGTPQDLSNLKYRRLREGLLAIFQHHPDLVYAAGHEHNLQYFQHADQHYVVSGSGSKSGYVEPGHGAMFTRETVGFADLRYFLDGSVWLGFYAPAEDGSAELLFTRRIHEADVESLLAETNAGDNETPSNESKPLSDASNSLADRVIGTPIEGTIASGRDSTGSGHRAETGWEPPYVFVASDTVEVAANPAYAAGSFRKFFLGEHYRDVWALPVRVPVIDLAKTAGGLTPLQKGGGLQTISLRLVGGDGDQYVLRSIDKDPTESIPEYLRETIAEDVVKDQITAMHPYGAFIIPKMAVAAGVYHTEPKLVVIPDDPRLGAYRSIFAGMLALFEARPDENQSDEARFGNAENVIGSTKLFEEIQEDNDERVDQRAFARARLFDMFIGDWDRHSDQWRWSEFDVTPGKIYRPIPRDRDFALFKFDGFLPSIARRTGDVNFRRFTNIENLYQDVYGLNYNGASMDLRFTSGLNQSDWLEIADSLQMVLTDDVIETAVRDLPDRVYEYHGPHIVELLKTRRDHLGDVAEEYYDMLARNVDIVGSDKHERFEVTRLDEDSTLVVMYKTSKEGDIERELIRRMLYTSETEEVRLYGLGGQDRFVLTGDVREGIRVRAIGGPDQDTFEDHSSVSGASKRTIFHDTVEGNQWITSAETKEVASNEPENNAYAMLRIAVNEQRPLIHFSRNTDDGLLVGGGIKIVNTGFRKNPYAAEHRILATAATKRRAFNAHYRGHYVEQFGTWDGYLEADFLADRNFRNFYGLGNDTDLEDRDFYHARIGRAAIEPSLSKHPLPFTTARIGPRFEVMNVELPHDADVQPTRFSDDVFVDKYFVGIHGDFQVDGTDSLAATEHGARWLTSAQANVGIRNTDNVFFRLTSEFSYFYTFYNPTRITVGFRAGGATNIGDFEFYQASTLGGQDNLRGYRKTRFAGRTAIFTNLDVRVQLFEYNVYLMRGIGGVIGFYDAGRVWADDLDLHIFDLHHGYGGGIWLAPFNRLAFTATIGISPENTLFDLSFGFQF